MADPSAIGSTLTLKTVAPPTPQTLATPTDDSAIYTAVTEKTGAAAAMLAVVWAGQVSACPEIIARLKPITVSDLDHWIGTAAQTLEHLNKLLPADAPL